MIDRRLIGQMDWLLFSVALLLISVGVLTIYSATLSQVGTHIYYKQLLWAFIGSLVLVVVIAVDYAHMGRFAYPIYVFSLALLTFALVFGRTIAGTQRWLSLGFITFQPSEFAKLAFIIALSAYLATRKVPPEGLGFMGLTAPSIIFAVPFILVARGPDLGTALVFLLIYASMMLTVKVRFKTLIGIAMALVAAMPLGWMTLKGYQKARLLSFIDPAGDPLGSGYHVFQSKIAIGSGGVFGKGFTKGTQGSLNFLPEHHTDFIFPVVAEEWGFLGSAVVLGLFMTLILRGVNAARTSKDRFGFLTALGVSAMFFWHVIINIGMTTGLLPVVGVPLPFMSYGGSFLMTSLIGVALLLNISMRRFIF